MKRVLLILSVTFTVVFLFLLFFSWLGNPFRTCTQFHTGTQYRGYQCGSTTEYAN
jgi:hypothetical protein